ncbi:MAG: MOSC domain-containing protein [Candidatus Binataceae bacterium]
MEKRKIGTVKALFRYPVKSMLGERLDEFEVGEQGVIGDRAWALREVVNGRVVTAKKWANMFEFHAAYEATPRAGELAAVRITLPDGRVLHADDGDAGAVLSSVLGRKVTLDRATAGQRMRGEIDPATVFADVPVERIFPGLTRETMPDTFGLPKGTFFDSAYMHVVASGTLKHMHHLSGEDAQLDPRRFRPNIFVETADGDEVFVEDGWLKGALEVGGEVKIVAMEPALRCVMTTHPQDELPRDLRILRAAAQHHQAKVGVFASIGAPGMVRVGDTVWLAE